MAFTAETGTGSSSANSLTSVAFADTYHADRNNTVWAGLSTGTKQGLLIEATDYLQNTAVFPWKGITKFATQALCWPRTGVVETSGLAVADDEVPLRVQKATADLALIANTTTLQPVIAAAAMGIKRQKVDVLETEYFSSSEAASTNPATQTATTTAAMGILQPLLRIQGTLSLATPYANLPPQVATDRADRPLFYVDQHKNVSG